MGNSILVLGATSAIATEVLRNCAKANWQCIIVGRSKEKLAELKLDLQSRGAESVECICSDLVDCPEEFWKEYKALSIDISHALIAYGSLPNQEMSEKNITYALGSIKANATSVIHHLIEISNYFEKRKSGHISVISSVAGDRGRKSNYTYGASKGFLSKYLQGIQNRLYSSGVKVLDIKPGFVGTPMTEHLTKRPLEANVTEVGQVIFSSISAQAEGVLYVPKKWFPIMTIIKSIPTNIYKRLSL